VSIALEQQKKFEGGLRIYLYVSWTAQWSKIACKHMIHKGICTILSTTRMKEYACMCKVTCNMTATKIKIWVKKHTVQMKSYMHEIQTRIDVELYLHWKRAWMGYSFPLFALILCTWPLMSPADAPRRDLDRFGFCDARDSGWKLSLHLPCEPHSAHRLDVNDSST
jgi:hypothetical protein